ncbi:MAG: hypothetical protein ACYTGM_21115 [Planctomycetota bacterium]
MAVAVVLTAAPPARAGDIPDVRINEIRVDQEDADTDEYFELRGVPGTSLLDVTYIVIGDPGDGYVEEVVDLSDHSIGPSGLFLVAESTFGMGDPDLIVDLSFENSDNVTHALVYQFTGSLGNDLDIDDDCLRDWAPWTAVIDLIALIEEENPPTGTECHYGPPVIGPHGAEPPWHVYRCEPSACWKIGANDLLVDDTPGAPNQPCLPCPWDCQATPNCVVDVSDFLAILAQWGQEGTSCDFGLGEPGVGINEFLSFLSNFGPCP